MDSQNGEDINDCSFCHNIADFANDNQGNIYVPITMRNKMPRVDIVDTAPLELEDQGFAILDKDLNIKKVYSMSEIFENAGLDYLLYSRLT